MAWFLLTMATIVLWGVTDILYRASLDRNDPLSHHKNFIWIGIIMALAGCIMASWSDTLFDSIKLVVEEGLYLVPLCFIYAIAIFFGLLGKKHLPASIISPLENIGGALVGIILYYYFLLTGYIDPSYTIEVLDFIATGIIIVAVIVLGCQEQEMFKQELISGEKDPKHRFGALVLFLPILCTLIDVFSVAEVGGISGNSGLITAGAEEFIPAIDFFVFECAGFAVASICMWLYLAIAKKHVYNPLQPEEMCRCGAAMGETFGTMTFIFASSLNYVLTAPVTSLHCLLTIVLARVFLKERLTKKQYVCVALLVTGIVLFGISDIF